MSILSRITPKISLAVIATVLAAGGAFAQDDERAERDAQKTKQAQAVSKEVYDKIQKAQEQVDAKDYQGALRALNNLYNPDKLTEYEQANVLNYIGFVYYNMEDIPNAIKIYEKMVAIPSLEPQMGKQTMYTLAQLYMQAEVPYKAATMLEKEMESGRVSKNAKNYRLLSQAWMLSQEDERAVPALKEAARLSDDGELDVRLGNTYLNLGNYDECISAVQTGLRKGGLKNQDNAQISLGMCLYNKRRYQAAIEAFRAAGKTPRSRKIAQQWISVIDADVERNEQIRLAQEAANKKRKEVEARRQQAGA